MCLPVPGTTAPDRLTKAIKYTLDWFQTHSLNHSLIIIVIKMGSPLATYMTCLQGLISISLPTEFEIVSDNARISVVVASNIDQEPVVRPSRWVAEKDSAKFSSIRADQDSTKVSSGQSSADPLAPKLPSRRGSIDPLAPKLPSRRRSIDYLPELQPFF
jgi:hypothetical protein